MINVSDAFKEELNNGNRAYLAYATITLTDGTRLSVNNEHIWANGVKIEESVSDSSSFSIGSAIASKLTLTLNNGYGDFTDYIFDEALVNIQIGLSLQNGTIERVNRGNYIVTEATGQNTSLVTLECLDYMYKFNKPYHEVQTVYPATMGDIILDICSHCEVTLGTLNFPRHDLSIPSRPEDEALSCLDVISYISQIACCFARMSNTGQLTIKWYDTNDITTTEQLITKAEGDYITTKSGDYIVVITPATDEDFIDGNIVTKIHRIQHTGTHTVQLDDVVITGIRVTNKHDEDTTSILSGSEGYVLGIDENPFIQVGYEETIADLIGERCIGMRFRPLSVTTLNDPTIEAGDRMYFISPIDNNVYKSYITSSTFAINDWQDLHCDAETPARNSATKYGAATKSFVALRKMVQNEKTSREQALEELSIRVDNSSGLYMTAEEQPDGSFIYYQHDKPTIAESSIIWKETAETRTVSTDGGQTWNAGITADGDAIVRLLQAEGINADWINAGTLVIRDNNNNIIFSASKETGTSGGSVFIGAGSVIIGGYGQVQSQSMSDALDSVKTYSDNQLTAYSQQVTQAFDEIQAQLDGQIDSWYYNYNPTLNNLPASDWTTEELKQEHEGDTFTNVDTGDAWRFIKDNNTWIWKAIADTAAAAALLAAQQAQQTADNKIRNFMTIPTPPYEEGDFWIKDDGTILICTNGKESGQAYSASDWEEKVKYTDDTVANQALEEARKAQALNIVLSNEYDSVPTDADGNYATFPSGIQTTVQTYFGHNDITSQCTYSVITSSAITGTWNASTKTYVVSGLLSDTGWVDITATYLGQLSATKRFTIAKVKQGVRGVQGVSGAKGDKGDRGDPGASGRVYILEPSTAVLSRSAMGDVTPASITWNAYYRDGDEARQPYAGRFKIEELENGEVWTTVYTSSQDETSCKYATGDQLIRKSNGDKLVTKANGDYLLGSHITATNIRCTLYHAGGVVTVLDQQSTPVVDDTAGLVVILTNEAVSVNATPSGEIPDYSECYTDIQVFYGNTNVTDFATYSTPVVSTGLTGTWNADAKRYSVKNLSGDDGYVDFNVHYKDLTITRRFTISKSKDGYSGTNGVVYTVEASATVVSRDAKGNTTPNVIEFNAYYKDGESARVPFEGRFKIESSDDGEAWTTVYTSSANESSCRYSLRHNLVTKSAKDKLITKGSRDYLVGPHVDGTMFKVTLYDTDGTTILDHQSIPVVAETSGLTVVLSNETISVTAETDGTIPDYSECFTNVQVFYGNADVTSLATYTVTRSSGLTGTWDGVNKRYTVTNLTPDDGYVDITITYKEVTVTRRFTVSKSKDGVWQNNVVELYALNNDANNPPADNAFTEGIKTPSESQRFLWNRERMIYSNGETLTLDKHLVAMYGETGNGISKIEEYYALSANTTAPADNAFTKDVKTPTSTNKYLWNYELITYTSGETKKTDKHIIGAYGDKGDRYYLEFSSKILKIGKNGVYTPSSITVSLRQVTGNTGASSAFTGRLKVVEWKNGQPKVIRTESATALSIYTYTPSEKNIDYIKFEMYNYINNAYNILDQESVQCMIDFDALTQEDVFNVLTNNGEWQGIYKDAGTGNYYLNFTFAKGGELVLGGLRNENGKLSIVDADKVKIVEANNTGIHIYKGSFTIKDGNDKTVFGVTSAGALTSISGSIGGINIADGKLYSGNKSTYDSTNQGFCFESDGKFGVGDSTHFLKWNGSDTLELQGKIVATTGSFGDINISSDCFYSGEKNTFGSPVNGFFFGSNGEVDIGNGTDYLRFSYNSKENTYTLSMAVTALTIGGSHVPTSQNVEDAAKTATNFLHYSDAGLVINKNESSETTGSNVLIDSSGLFIRSGSTVCSSFTSNGLELGSTGDSKGKLVAYRDASNIGVEINSGGVIVYGTYPDNHDLVLNNGYISFRDSYGSSRCSISFTQSSIYGYYGLDLSGGFVDISPSNTVLLGTGNTTNILLNSNGVKFYSNVDFSDATVTGITIEATVPDTINHGLNIQGDSTVVGVLTCNGISTKGMSTTNGYQANFYSVVYFHNLGSEQLTSNYRLLRIDNNNQVRFCNPSSSIRYKEVQRDLTEKDIAKAYNIQPKMAKYKEGVIAKEDQRYNKYFPMFVAEDVYDNLPDAVDFNEDGQIETWNQMIMIPLMFQMLKSQKEEIEELKKQLNNLN